MSFFPSDYNPRDPVVAMLDLCEIDAASGVARFIIGQDGVFTASDGTVWYGSALGQVSQLQSAIDGRAPEGSMTLSYFQDPDDQDLIDAIKESGDADVTGREVRFYVQPIRSAEELYAPQTPPLLWLTRIMRQITFEETGPQSRQISVSFESWAEARAGARRIQLNEEGHATLIGEANPSLRYMPTVDFQEEKLF